VTDHRYTFFLEFDGGTFISQLESKALERARDMWVKQVDFFEIGAPEESRSNFEVDAVQEELTVIKDVKNVWCFSPEINGMLAIVHVVKSEI